MISTKILFTLFAAAIVWYRKAIIDFIGLIPFWKGMYGVKKHVIYTKIKYGENSKQYFLHCLPSEKVPPKNKVVLYFHGGGWQFGKPEGFIPSAQLLTDHGYTVFMASHRKLPFNNYTEMREDISLTILKVLETMKENGLSNEKLILGGMSSGGNLSALLYFNEAELDRIGVPKHRINAVILQGAPLDLDQMKFSPTLINFAGLRSREKYKAASPINYLTQPDNRPILLTHGNADGIVEYECTSSFVKKLKELGYSNVQFNTIEGAGHMDIVNWAFKDNNLRKSLLDWLEKV